MNLKEQQYVVALARCGTITRAAEELFLTAPALSMFLSNLEKNLGTRLFDRTGKTLLPTPIGEKYIACAEQMLRLKGDFDRELAREIGLQKQTVRIGIQMRRAISAIPWLLACFQEEMPSLHVVFQEGAYSELLKLQEQHQVDYLFYTMGEPVPGTEYVLLEKEPILAAASKDAPCVRQARVIPEWEYPCLEPEDLRGETLILPPKDQGLRVEVDRLLEKAGVRPGSIVEIRQFATIIQMAASGLGIGFNRMGYLKDMRQPENIRYFLLGEEPFSSSLVLLFAKEKKNSLYHDRLVQIFEEYMKGS